jgi:hypothetical protein
LSNAQCPILDQLRKFGHILISCNNISH